MKKIFLIILIMLITGCENNDTTEENLLNDLIKINKKFNLKEESFICNELNENSIIDGNIFVTGTKIYELNLQKIYSNETNCIEVGELQPGRYAKYINRGTIIDNKGEGYRLQDPMRNDDYNYEKKEYKYDSNIKSNIVDLYGSDSIYSDNGYANKYYTADNVIYDGMKLIGYHSKLENTKSYDEIINTDAISNEKIINIYGYIIKTNKNFYIINSRKTNAEECNKYADIKCKYEYYLKRSEILSKYYDLILNINSNEIITKKNTYIDFYNIN